MKKIKFLSILFAVSTIFAACEKPETDNNGPGGLNPSDTTGTNPPPGPGPSTNGDGTEAKPYSVEDYLTLTVPEKDNGTDTVWIEAYIVGCYNFDQDPKFIIGSDNAINTNILIADDPNSTDTYKVVSIKLTSGLYRDALNLSENAGNYKKKVKLYGISEKYCGINGVIDIEKAYLDGVEVVAKPLEGFFTESFADGQGDFTIVDVNLPEELTKIWSYDPTYEQMKAGCYDGENNYGAESWLISPAIDLSGKTSATLTFKHSGKQFNAPFSFLTVQVSTTYTGGDIVESEWTNVVIPTYMTGTNNDFVSSGEMNLSAYVGQPLYIAFKYTSEDNLGGNWYIKNVIVDAE